jgi:hypothetical protein
MAASSRTLLDTAVSALQFPDDALARIVVQGSGALPSAFPVTDFAVEAIAAAGLGIRELLALSGVIRGDGVRGAMEQPTDLSRLPESFSQPTSCQKPSHGGRMHAKQSGGVSSCLLSGVHEFHDLSLLPGI